MDWLTRIFHQFRGESNGAMVEGLVWVGVATQPSIPRQQPPRSHNVPQLPSHFPVSIGANSLPSFPPGTSPRTPGFCYSVKQIGLVAALNAAIADPRAPERITHPQSTLLAQRLLALAAGYEDLNDHQRLRSDPLWQAATDHPEVDDSAELASPPTLCRLENRISRRDLVRIAAVLVDQFIASFPTPPAELTLDIDATDDLIHGNQEKNFFHGYYDHHCFLPLYVT